MNRPSSLVNTNIIPRIDSTIKISHRARYTCTTNSVINITRANMLNTLIMNINNTTTNGRLISGIKLNRIEIYGAPSGPIALEWLSTLGPTRELSDRSLTNSAIPCIKSSPPKQSLAGFWSMTGSQESDVLCTITTNGSGAACTVDVWTSIILMDGEPIVGVTTTSTGTSATLYLTRFDGPGASAVLIPDNYTTIN